MVYALSFEEFQKEGIPERRIYEWVWKFEKDFSHI